MYAATVCFMVLHLLFVITLTSLDETDRSARPFPSFSAGLLFANPAYSVDTPDGKQESFQMVKSLLSAVNKMLSHDDVGKLLLRLAVGGLMLFHGLHKLFAGVDGISGMLVAKGLPGFIAYGVLVGEVVAPCLLILGILTRPAALVLAFTMIVAWLMVGMGETGSLDKTGAWAIESLVYFFTGALAIACLGAGRFSVAGNSVWR
jgi:putative oxidoreductase